MRIMKKILLIVCCLGCLLSITGCGDKELNSTNIENNNSGSTVNDEVRERDKYSENEYKSLCEKLDYKTIARNPDANYLKKVYGTGEIVQVVQEEGTFAAFRANITPVMNYDNTEVSYYENTVLLYTYNYDRKNRLLEDDIIDFWGIVAEEFTYDTIFGASETIPSIQIDYFELKK